MKTMSIAGLFFVMNLAFVLPAQTIFSSCCDGLVGAKFAGDDTDEMPIEYTIGDLGCVATTPAAAIGLLVKKIHEKGFLCEAKELRPCVETCIAQGAWEALNDVFAEYPWLAEYFVDLDETGHCVNALVTIAEKYNAVAACRTFLKSRKLSDFKEKIPTRFQARTAPVGAAARPARAARLPAAAMAKMTKAPRTSKPHFRSCSEIREDGRYGVWHNVDQYTVANSDGSGGGQFSGTGKRPFVRSKSIKSRK
jgi:hypothetical protein